MSLKEKYNVTGMAMNLMTRFASSNLPDRMGVRKKSEQSIEAVARKAVTAMQGTGKKSSSKAAKNTTPGETTYLFDLNLSEEQQMIVDSLRDFAEHAIRPMADEANEAEAMPEELLSQAAELGLAAFVVPEEMGGVASRRSPITSVLIAETLAHGDMGLAVGLLAPMSFANAISQWGSKAQQNKYLSEFVSESAPMATIAINEPGLPGDDRLLSTKASRRVGGWSLSGKKTLVPLAKRSAYILVSAQTLYGPKLFVVDRHAKGVTITSESAMGLKAAELATVELRGVKVAADACIGGNDFAYDDFLNMARVGWCALAVGTSQAVLDYVVPYCNEREAFGEPISHRQAVAFMVANIGIELEGMRMMTYKAASRAEHGGDLQRYAFLAYTQCSEYSMQIGTDGVQLLGGHGFTKEYPVERWYRDLRAIAVMQNAMHI